MFCQHSKVFLKLFLLKPFKNNVKDFSIVKALSSKTFSKLFQQSKLSTFKVLSTLKAFNAFTFEKFSEARKKFSVDFQQTINSVDSSQTIHWKLMRPGKLSCFVDFSLLE